MPPSADTTSRSIAIICADTVLEMTRRPWLRLGRSLPMRWTRCGTCITPPFAIAAYAVAIWIGVTPMPCPIGTFPIVDPDQ